ncbi:MAG: hypothetical protein II473_01325, partial [Clostridia bacterium]|nr:hypothetical protein [Clostridia bacterium]
KSILNQILHVLYAKEPTLSGIVTLETLDNSFENGLISNGLSVGGGKSSAGRSEKAPHIQKSKLNCSPSPAEKAGLANERLRPQIFCFEKMQVCETIEP